MRDDSAKRHGMVTLLCLAAAAALLLPASASAAINSYITIEGSGSGEVVGIEPSPGAPEPIACKWNGETEKQTGVCAAEAQKPEPEAPIFALSVKHVAAPGSKFAGWTVEQGGAIGCSQGNPKAGSCSVTLSKGEIKIKAAFEALPPVALTIAESGPGSVTVECEEGSGFEACAKPLAELDYGTGVRVTASPEPSAKLKSLSGTGSAAVCTKSPCEFTLTEDSEFSAVFVPIVISPVQVAVAGQGTVSSAPPGIECTEAGNGTPACEEEFEDGEAIALQAKAAEGWIFTEWTEGPCAGKGSASCEFTMPTEAVQAAALFEEISGAQLTVIKGGHPEGGTVVSFPAGISCGLACVADTEIFQKGAAVTLTAAAKTGYAFAGWLGCKYVGPGVCEVTVAGLLTEVTAVFVKDGEAGEAGEDGEGVTVTPEPPGANCPNGGVKVESASGTEYVCAGGDGQDGPEGPQGPIGPSGTEGNNGRDGVPGPAGPQGPRGPAGSARVTCKVHQAGKGVRVSCQVHRAKQSKRAGQMRRLRWALMRGGHAVSHGEATVARLQRVLNRLRPGRYVLRIGSQKGGIAVVR